MAPAPDPKQVVNGDASGDAVLALTLARLEAKIDVILAQHEARIEQHEDDLDDHEARLRALEARPTVSPRALWTSVSSGVAVMAVIGPLLARLYS